MKIYDSASKSNLLDFQNNDLNLKAEVAVLDTSESTIKQVLTIEGGSSEVGKPSPVLLKLTNSVPLRKETLILIELPPYNPQASPSKRKSYV